MVLWRWTMNWTTIIYQSQIHDTTGSRTFNCELYQSRHALLKSSNQSANSSLHTSYSIFQASKAVQHFLKHVYTVGCTLIQIFARAIFCFLESWFSARPLLVSLPVWDGFPTSHTKIDTCHHDHDLSTMVNRCTYQLFANWFKVPNLPQSELLLSTLQLLSQLWSLLCCDS